ncbi:MAG: pyridoxamine 5'-phosphate oxidase family protein [Acidobacteriota bacterium]
MSELYHRGEIALQELTGERAQALLNGRVIVPVVPPPARPFVGQQTSVAVGWLDQAGQPWASLIVGEPGFASCSDDGTAVTLRGALPSHVVDGDTGGVREGGAVGMLVIDLATRRRLRVNGVAGQVGPRGLRVAVEQAYPNCPKYIQKRERLDAPATAAVTAFSSGSGLPPGLEDWLSSTDTAFVATVGPDGRVDCSHRGGRRAFLRMDGDAILMPDYPGNSMFCTLGNIFAEPRAGLALVDFEGGRQLHLSGDAWVEVAGAGRTNQPTGAGRWWRLRPLRWVVTPLGGNVAWRLVEESPFNPPVQP